MDALTGLGVSLYIMYSAFTLFREAIRNLADEEFEQNDRDKVITIAAAYSSIKGIHELTTRYAANKPFIQFHLELDGNLTLYQSHEIADELMFALLKEFPEAEITIHQDPVGLERNVKYRENYSFENKFMQLALEQAQKAFDDGEVPVGCVIVDSTSHNVVAATRNRIQKTKTLIFMQKCEL